MIFFKRKSKHKNCAFHIHIEKIRLGRKLFKGRIATKQITESLKEQYDTCPTSRCEYEIDGKKYIVIRHFVGNKEIDRLMSELAVSQANREMGL